MDRISNNYIRNNFMHNVNRQQTNLEEVNRQIASQKKLSLPEDDPVAVAELMFQRSRMNDIERYERNIDFSKGRLDLMESKMGEVNNLLHRARELAIQGANGIYTKEETQKMGAEVNQILEQVVQLANSKYKGQSLFGGTHSQEEPFRLSYGKITNPVNGQVEWGETSITKVEYQGDIGRRYAEVGRGEYIPTNIPGNDVFWATQQNIVSGTPGTGYIARTDQSLKIDGVEIQIKAGDNIRTVADKINAANINVHAEIDNTSGQNLFILRTTQPHQMWLEDIAGGTVLQDLGMVSSSVARAPFNYAPSAAVHGESLFDRLITLRDSLYTGNTEEVNASIGGLDQGVSNGLRHLSVVGSVQTRMESTMGRLASAKVYAAEVINSVDGLDMAEAMTKLKNLEMENNAALMIGSRLLPKTLLDYLR